MLLSHLRNLEKEGGGVIDRRKGRAEKDRMEQRGRQLVGGVQARREEEETGEQREGCMWIGEMEKGS